MRKNRITFCNRCYFASSIWEYADKTQVAREKLEIENVLEISRMVKNADSETIGKKNTYL